MWHETHDSETWLRAAAHLLDPVEHTVALTQAENLRGRPDLTAFAWWEANGDVTGAAMLTPGHPAILCCAPDDALIPLADLWDLTTANGETSRVVHLGAVAARGRTVTLHRAQRLYRLSELRPRVVPGSARLATLADHGLVVAWFQAFLDEARITEPQTDLPAMVAGRLEGGQLLLWEHDGVVALCGRQKPAAGAVRLGPVYTPPEQRGRGYGGAATSAMAELCAALAQHVVLFTDLTNPTSNGLYQRLGFVPLSDRAVIEISP